MSARDHAYHHDHQDEHTRLKRERQSLDRAVEAERERIIESLGAMMDRGWPVPDAVRTIGGKEIMRRALQLTSGRPSDDFEGCVE